jgi:hypothetical protein
VRQDGWQAAIFGGRNRPSLLMVAHQLANASEVTCSTTPRPWVLGRARTGSWLRTNWRAPTDFAQDYRIAEITVPLLQRAALLADTHALRLQIPALILVSGDGDLNAAATAEGLPVEDPNTHT